MCQWASRKIKHQKLFQNLLFTVSLKPLISINIFSPENQIAKKWDALLDIPFFYISLIISLEVWTGSIPPQTGTDQIWAT